VFADAQIALQVKWTIVSTMNDTLIVKKRTDSWIEKSDVQTKRVTLMLYTIAVVLLILWLLGLVSSYTIGGFIHVLLVIAIVMVLLRVINGRKAG
jgi:hypothetical protein